jgi:hypothetical protein
MSNAHPPRVTVESIARELDGFHHRRLVRVDLQISGTSETHVLPPRISLWFTEAEVSGDFGKAEERAKGELQRISALLSTSGAPAEQAAREPPAGPKPDQRWEQSDATWVP